MTFKRFALVREADVKTSAESLKVRLVEFLPFLRGRCKEPSSYPSRSHECKATRHDRQWLAGIVLVPTSRKVHRSSYPAAVSNKIHQEIVNATRPQAFHPSRTSGPWRFKESRNHEGHHRLILGVVSLRPLISSASLSQTEFVVPAHPYPRGPTRTLSRVRCQTHRCV